MIKTIQQEVLNSKGFEIITAFKTCSAKELKEKSYLVAAYLLDSGLGPGKRVVLQMSRDIGFMAALSGTFMSGATVVILPIDMPKNRYEYILDDLKPTLVITDDKYKEIIGAKISFDISKVKMSDPENEAFILYTSGSTGVPKGVIHTQESILKVAGDLKYECAPMVAEVEKVVALTDFTFISFMIFEYGYCMLRNKAMRLMSEDEMNSVKALSKALEADEKISIFMTPSRYRAMAEADEVRKSIDKCGVLIFAGEKLPKELEDEVKKEYSDGISILDVYGSTECGLVFIRDIRNGKCTVCAPFKIIKDEKVTDGEGELCVQDERIFKKYSGPSVKKEVVADGVSYFPTGDIAVVDKDGTISILGRNDRMIKYNGLRIELDEISEVLKGCEKVTGAAVVYSKAFNRIAAFYTAEEELEVKDLRQEMSNVIPFYMLPHSFMYLEEIPLNEHDKVDYTKLTELFDDTFATAFKPQSEADAEVAESLTDNERVLSEILGKLLGTSVSMNASCMELGIDSLMGLTLIGELNDRNLSVSLKDIILSETLHDLALRINSKEETRAASAKASYESIPVTDGYLTFLIGAEKSGNDFMAMWIKQSFIGAVAYSKESFEERIALLTKRHPVLTSQFVEAWPGQYIQEFGKAYPHVSFFDITGASEEEIKERIAEYENVTLKELDEKEGKRESSFACFKLDENRCAMHIKISHVISDGMSQQVLKCELLEDTLPDEEDAYFEYLKWMKDEENRKQAMEFFKNYVKDADYAFTAPTMDVPSGMPPMPPMDNIPTMPDMPPMDDMPAMPPMPDLEGMPQMSMTGNIIKMVPMGRTKDLKGITPFVYILYRYANALIDTFEKDRMVFYITSSGRNIPVTGMDKVVGELSGRMPVVINKGQSIQSFMEGLYEAENHRCIAPEELWMDIFGEVKDPVNMPILVSEVFPDYTGGKLVCELSEKEFDAFGVNAYFLEEEGNMFIRISYNPAIKDGAIYQEFITNLENEAK